MKKGFTLAELLIVIVIIAVLASIAIPTYTGLVERQRRNQAFTYLRLIKAAERIYRANNGRFLACGSYDVCTGVGVPLGTGMPANLGVNLTQENFTFRVVNVTATTFRAEAVRITAPSYTIGITQADPGWVCVAGTCGTLPTN